MVIMIHRFINTKQDAEEVVQNSEKIEIMNMMNGDIKDSIKKQVQTIIFNSKCYHDIF